MDKIILNLMFKYKSLVTFSFVFIYFVLLIFCLSPITLSNILGSFIFLLLLIASVWNVSFIMLDSINESSQFSKILGRGILIFSYFITMVLVMAF